MTEHYERIDLAQQWAIGSLQVFNSAASPVGDRLFRLKAGALTLEFCLRDEDVKRLLISLISGDAESLAVLATMQTQRVSVEYMKRNGMTEISMETLNMKPIAEIVDGRMVIDIDKRFGK